MRLVPRLRRVQLNGEFTGIWVDFNVNTPMEVFEDLIEGDTKTRKAALARLVYASNVEDEDGNPIDLHTAAGWGRVPPDLWQDAATKIQEALSPPKASSTESTTSSSGTTPAESPTTTPA